MIKIHQNIQAMIATVTIEIFQIMTMNRWGSIFLCCLLLCSCTATRYQGESSSRFEVPIHFISCSDASMVTVNIEGIPCRMTLDLGANIVLSLEERILHRLQEKTPFGISSTFDIQGNRYDQNQFKIARFRFGCFEVTDPIATEESALFMEHGRYVVGGPNQSLRSLWQRASVDGRIGNEIFIAGKCACFLDLSQPSFFVGTTVSDIISPDHLEKCIHLELEIRQGFPCIILDTASGKKCFILDSGSSRSLLQGSVLRAEFTKLVLEHFGKWDFCVVHFPEQLSFFDGILGVDFMKKHPLCLDFANQKAYIW